MNLGWGDKPKIMGAGSHKGEVKLTFWSRFLENHDIDFVVIYIRG